MLSVTEAITINAIPEFIWPILLSSHEYENWNPIYAYIEGFVEPHGKLIIEVDLDVEKVLSFMDVETAHFLKNTNKPPKTKRHYNVTTFREPHLLAWESKALDGFLIRLVHRFELIAKTDGTTTLKTSMIGSGFLTTLVPEPFFRNYHKALCMAFNHALKWYVEEGYATKLKL